MINNLIKKLEAIAGSRQQAQYEAWLLLEKITGLSRVMLLVKAQPLTLDQQKALDELVEQRLQGKPLAYILGDIPFAGITLAVRPPILIPRPETEEMGAWVIDRFAQYRDEPLVVLDMCTGSGCIALALAAAFPAWQIVGVDINPAAIELAQENKNMLALSNVSFIEGSLFNSVMWARPFDLIISNPPYISESSHALVGKDVLAWEDKGALFADDNGYAFYHELIAQAKKLITSPCEGRPHLIFEFGVDQKDMAQYLSQQGCRSIEIHKDCAGVKRWSGCQI